MISTTIILGVTLIVLVGLSALFSGSETVLFGLTADERWRLRQNHAASAKVIDQLLTNPRRLLLSVLLGNMTVNSLFFAAGTVMLIGTELPPLWQVAVGILQVVGLVLLGEVLPKVVGNSMRLRIAPLVARPIFILHTIATPIRAVIERLVFEPLNRISEKSLASAGPTTEELGEVVRAAGIRNDISSEEAALLARLLVVRRKRVRDVMTHRTEIKSVSHRATGDEVVAVCKRARLKRLPVVDRSVDQISGILDARAYLLDSRGFQTPLEAHTKPATYIPEFASLEQLLDLFRKHKCSLLVAVDEFGGTAGIVALEDAIEEIVGDIAAPEESVPAEPMPVGPEQWRIDGAMPAGAFCAFMGIPMASTRASLVAGIASDELGEVPSRGSSFEWQGLRFVAEFDEQRRTLSYLVTRLPHSDELAEGSGQ